MPVVPVVCCVGCCCTAMFICLCNIAAACWVFCVIPLTPLLPWYRATYHQHNGLKFTHQLTFYEHTTGQLSRVTVHWSLTSYILQRSSFPFGRKQLPRYLLCDHKVTNGSARFWKTFICSAPLFILCLPCCIA